MADPEAHDPDDAPVGVEHERNARALVAGDLAVHEQVLELPAASAEAQRPVPVPESPAPDDERRRRRQGHDRRPPAAGGGAGARRGLDDLGPDPHPGFRHGNLAGNRQPIGEAGARRRTGPATAGNETHAAGRAFHPAVRQVRPRGATRRRPPHPFDGVEPDLAPPRPDPGEGVPRHAAGEGRGQRGEAGRVQRHEAPLL